MYVLAEKPAVVIKVNTKAMRLIHAYHGHLGLPKDPVDTIGLYQKRSVNERDRKVEANSVAQAG